VSSYTLMLNYIDVQDQDLVLFLFDSADTATVVPTGFVQISGAVSGSANGYYKVWSTGDSKSPAWTFSAANYKDMYTVCLRKSGSGLVNPTIDQATANSSTGSGARTASPNSMTPADAAELLLLFYGTGNSASGAWSSPPTVTVTLDIGNANAPANLFYILPAASPSGTLNDTWTRAAGASDTLTALGILIKTSSGGGGGGGGAGAGGGGFLVF
jgi:hypothetical protein